MRGLAHALSALALLGAGCSMSTTAASEAGPGNDAGSTSDAFTPVDSGHVGRVPLEHRDAPVACSHTRGPGDAITGDPSAACTMDSDCTAGQNGRCLVTTVAARLNYCSYDECFADADCATGDVCRCREFDNDANACVMGNCVVDADCGAGGFCSPSRGFDRINFGVSGYWCHTASDECIDDVDCATDGGPDAACVWYPDRMHWACSSMGFFPP